MRWICYLKIMHCKKTVCKTKIKLYNNRNVLTTKIIYTERDEYKDDK